MNPTIQTSNTIAVFLFFSLVVDFTSSTLFSCVENIYIFGHTHTHTYTLAPVSNFPLLFMYQITRAQNFYFLFSFFIFLSRLIKMHLSLDILHFVFGDQHRSGITLCRLKPDFYRHFFLSSFRTLLFFFRPIFRSRTV